ncbi:MAG: hypothetical protein AAGE59_19780 [Cyanobacteria bacterium P01_F01_bin.86]
MPKRVTVTLPDPVADSLAQWSEWMGQSLATCAALVIEMGIEVLKEKGEIPPPKSQK